MSAGMRREGGRGEDEREERRKGKQNNI